MLKRYRKPKVNGIVGVPACTSSNIEKIIDDHADITSNLFDSDSDRDKEIPMEEPMVNNVSKNDECSDIADIFYSCGLCITEEPSNTLSSYITVD